MTYKSLVLLLVVLSLAGCASAPSFMGGSAKSVTSDPTSAEAKADDEKSVLSNASLESEPPAPATSPEMLKAQALISQSDLYKGAKRTLSANAKTQVIAAIDQFNQGDIAASEKILAQVMATEVNLSSPVYVLAGDIALAKQNVDEAIVHYQQAIKLNQYNAKAANRLGMQMREQGKFTEAEKYFSLAIYAQPSLPQSYRNRAVLFDLYLGEKEKAQQDYQSYSALLNYQLALNEHINNPSGAENSFSHPLSNNYTQAHVLSDSQMQELRANLTLVERWLIDIGRQVEALKKAELKNAARSGSAKGE